MEIGSREVGIAWLLLFFGPIGWIILLALSLHQQQPEVLRFVLPLSDAAWEREGRARREYRDALVLTAIGRVGFIGAMGFEAAANCQWASSRNR